MLYVPYAEAPKTLDPQVAYSVYDHEVIANVYETLLEYHYLKRPYELIPGLVDRGAGAARARATGASPTRFALRRGRALRARPVLRARRRRPRRSASSSRPIFVFALQRIADPKVGSPVLVTFSKIVGLAEFGKRLAKLREDDPAFASLRIDEQYQRAGPIEGLNCERHR